MTLSDVYDLLVVGGGIHGAAVARDAAGRGLRVVLVEQYDVAAATSMASSKLIHGGLRYLEQGHLRLVREALHERDILLRVAPHLVRPLPFVLPLGPGSRPAWQLRLGLWLYDFFAGQSSLSRSHAVDLTESELGLVLRPEYRRGFVYTDAWGDDARLVVVNARDAADRGAVVLTRTRCERLEANGSGWLAYLRGPDISQLTVSARAVVNATGPWVVEFLRHGAGIESRAGVRLVKGSHLVLRRKLPSGHAFLMQNDDKRVVFAIPIEREFILLGTTDVPMKHEPGLVSVSASEVDYLRRAAARYFVEPIRDEEIVWSFAGIRALYDDGSKNPSQVNRDYVLEVDRAANGASILSVFGGKLTTYRKLAERVVDRLARELGGARPAWTADAALPGGAIPGGDLNRFTQELMQRHPALPAECVSAIAGRHGSSASEILRSGDMGQYFGGGLTAIEIDYLLEREWAMCAEDVLYRRTKAGIHLDDNQRADVDQYIRMKLFASSRQ